ncbi:MULTISPECIES: hypothetical protein [unclassified Brevibacterium]|uniref:hypothetical protein n=1 Tax=unclassified Brevibacterium TaxID=2614124 RepID=UPI001E5ADC5B|nr:MULTISPECIES: hypothetical protein [unclassified Brevibacterium]MCD1285720.1 hypothetical protein [Brevibacterium sp. CCUG 69071]MDK8434780.1 hypothetical protein [Brevibacterium sp. H-BE7]
MAQIITATHSQELGTGSATCWTAVYSERVAQLIYALHHETTQELARGGVDYANLRWVPTPRATHSEIAFLFDSTAVGSDHYGFELSKTWLPALWRHGPQRTAISQGDILNAPPGWVWKELDGHLVCTNDFPQLATEQYYALYLTNMSRTQVLAIDAALRDSTGAYLGYIDCSTWTPLKSFMLLPQYAIRDGDALVVAVDEDGSPHVIPPSGNHGFRLVGVEETLYGVVLDHRMDNGVPEWAHEDSALTLTVLGGGQSPLSELKLDLDERRFTHLTSEADGHGASVRRAGLDGLSREELVQAIEAKIRSGLMFRLRFVHGTRAGEPTPENDALMFTVPVEFPDSTGKVRRYQVGVKYFPASHSGEVVTFH